MSNNIYVVGRFMCSELTNYNADGSVTLPTLEKNPLHNSDSNNGYIAKYDFKGQTLWESKITCASYNSITAVAVDTQENLYVAGSNNDPITIYNANGINSTLPSPKFINNKNRFLVQYNDAGVAQWVANVVGSAPEYLTNVNINVMTDRDNNIYINGNYKCNTLSFYNADGIKSNVVLHNTTNQEDGYLVKYNQQGDALWGAFLSSPNYSTFTTNIITDKIGNIYIPGAFTGETLHIYNASLQDTLQLSNTQPEGNYSLCGYIIQYNSQGQPIWGVKQGGTDGITAINKICSDVSGNIIISIISSASILSIYNANGSISIPYIQNPVQSGIVAKYDNKGTALWAARIGYTTGYSLAYQTCIDNNENIYVGGIFEGSKLSFYNANGSLSNVPDLIFSVQGEINGYVCQYNSQGTALWAAKIGGLGPNGNITYSTTDNAGNIYITGIFSSHEITFYNAYNSVSLPALKNTQSDGKFDGFIVKYSPEGKALWSSKQGGTNGDIINLNLASDNFTHTNICFPPETPVRTDQGTFPISQLVPHNHTISGKPIQAIVKTPNHEHELVCFEVDSLGKSMPNKRTLISKEHKIFYKGSLIPAKFFVGALDADKVHMVDYHGKKLYNVLLKTHESMRINGLKVETLHPLNPATKLHFSNPLLEKSGAKLLFRKNKHKPNKHE